MQLRIRRAHRRDSTSLTTALAWLTRPMSDGGGRSMLPRRPLADGLRVLPFRAVRYESGPHPDLAPVLAPPYDVIDDVQRAELEATDEHNVVRLILPREPASGSGDRYTAAASLYSDWLARGILGFDEQPALYFYEQRRDGAVVQAGLFAAIGLEPLDAGVIFPHEAVRPGPVEDRLALMRAMQANPEPILLVYDGGGRTSQLCQDATGTESLRSALTHDGITHRLWAITDDVAIQEIHDELATFAAMIADGHHRYTTYGYLRAEHLAQASGHATEDGATDPWDFGLALLIDLSAADPDVRAIHRVVPGIDVGNAASRAARGFESVIELEVDRATNSETNSNREPELLARLEATPGHAFIISNGSRHFLVSDPRPDLLAAAKPTDRSNAWWALDASVASAFLLGELWQVADVEGVLEAEHDPTAALRMAAEENGVALLLKPPPLADIIAVAVAGDTMPRKSTLFGPKPRSGVVLRSLDPSRD
jgi:uncharacterized protein (DUF1015 family)